MSVVRQFFSFFNLYAQLCQELPNYIHSDILDTIIVVLAAVIIFPPLPMHILGNKYEIHQLRLAQMILDLPAWGVSCVYWALCQSWDHPSLYLPQTPPWAETNWSRNYVPDTWRIAETPLCSMSKKEMDSPAFVMYKQISALPWLASWEWGQLVKLWWLE